MSIFHTDMCANTMLDTMLDEKKIVLVLLNWSFNTTDMFGSHTCVCEWGGQYINWRRHNYLRDFVVQIEYLTPIQAMLVFISFHVGLMKCMLSSFQLLP